MDMKYTVLVGLMAVSLSAVAARAPKFEIKGNPWHMYHITTFSGKEWCEVGKDYDKEYQKYVIGVGLDRVMIAGSGGIDYTVKLPYDVVPRRPGQALKINGNVYPARPTRDAEGSWITYGMEFTNPTEIIAAMLTTNTVEMKLNLGPQLGIVIRSFDLSGFAEIYPKLLQCNKTVEDENVK